jgi:hypothetical protein
MGQEAWYRIELHGIHRMHPLCTTAFLAGATGNGGIAQVQSIAIYVIHWEERVLFFFFFLHGLGVFGVTALQISNGGFFLVSLLLFLCG